MPILVLLLTVLTIILQLTIEVTPTYAWITLLAATLLGCVGWCLALISAPVLAADIAAQIRRRSFMGIGLSVLAVVGIAVSVGVDRLIAWGNDPVVRARVDQLLAERRLLAEDAADRQLLLDPPNDREAERTYRRIFLRRWQHGDKYPRLPEYRGKFPTFDADVFTAARSFQWEPAEKDLIASTTTEQGLSIQRINLAGSTLIPQVVVRQNRLTQANELFVLQTDGMLLQLKPETWQLQQQHAFKSTCTNFGSAGKDTLWIVAKDPGRVILLEHYVPKQRWEIQTAAIANAEHVYGAKYGYMRVLSGGDVPYLAQFDDRTQKLRKIQPFVAVGPPPEKARFLLSQRAKSANYDNTGKFIIAGKEGVLAGKLPYGGHIKLDQKWIRRLQVTLDEVSINVTDGAPKVASTEFNLILPANRCRIETFAPFGADEFGIADGQQNLQIYDRSGQLKANFKWPGAGKTLGIVDIPHEKKLIVFTEQSVYVVTPATE